MLKMVMFAVQATIEKELLSHDLPARRRLENL